MFCPLEEKEFIQEEYSKNPFPFWASTLCTALLVLLLSGTGLGYFFKLADYYSDSPFLQVTNRKLSLFLWQHPQYMRVFAKNKNGYLPAFHYIEKPGLNPEYADEYAIAPPEVLFHYHLWDRLVKGYLFKRSIPLKEFQNFLKAAPEWTPRFWKEAPAPYIALLDSLSKNEGMADLSFASLPLDVQQAFYGWKNFFLEGELINEMTLNRQEMKAFINRYPHYSRNYWVNIAGEHYLKSLESRLINLPKKEVPPFLRVAFYNDQMKMK